MEKNLQGPAASRPTLSSQPWFHQQGEEIQAFGTVRLLPLGLSRDERLYPCQRLNQILADTQILHALYKKHHWLMRGATFYQLHLLLDKHAGEQIGLVDSIAERVQTLGGVAVGDPRHVAELTRISRAPHGCEEVPAMLSRLLERHELILTDCARRGGAGCRTGRRRHERPDRLGGDPHGRVAGVVPRGTPRRHPARPALSVHRVRRMRRLADASSIDKAARLTPGEGRRHVGVRRIHRGKTWLSGKAPRNGCFSPSSWGGTACPTGW